MSQSACCSLQCGNVPLGSQNWIIRLPTAVTTSQAEPHAAGALLGTKEEGDERPDSDSDSNSDSEGHGEAGQSKDQAAEQSQHGDTRRN
jgi:hypothetical protein